MKKFLKCVGIFILVIMILIGGFLGYLTATEYKPEAVENIEVNSLGGELAEKELSVLTWNIGYGGLGAASDFFMDGGKDTVSADKSTVNAYLDGISELI